MTVARSLDMAVRNRTWGPTRSLETPAWSDYQSVFAQALKPQEWTTVASYVEQLRHIDRTLVAAHAPGSDIAVVALSDEVVESFRQSYGLCLSAYAALHRVSGEPQSVKELNIKVLGVEMGPADAA
jgi:hypothetical protein